jgi:hypothetical protein
MLLYSIFPGYPDFRGMNSTPNASVFLLEVRSQNSPIGELEGIFLKLTTANTKAV